MALQRAGIQYVNEGLDGFLRGVDRASDAVQGFGRTVGTVGTSVGSFGNIAVGAFRELGAIGVRALAELGRAGIALSADLGGKALTSAMDFQDSMNLLAATSGATADEIDKLKQRAKELGADLTLPATSAADAGTAMLELSKAGLTVDQVMNAAKGTLQLAAAANISEAEAAEIAANALGSFRLEGERANFVADLLANAANKSSIEVREAADSFKMASSIFSAFQAPVVGSEKAMTDLTTAIALLGNAGIKGSDAGTSLKQMLLQLTGPSQIAKEKMIALAVAAQSTNIAMDDLSAVGFGNATERSKALANMMRASGKSLESFGDIAYDARGRMRSLVEIIDLVRRGTAKMTAEQRDNYLTSIFGADATRAVITLMQAGPEAFDEMSAAIARQGGAAELAAARTAGLRGAWDGFLSTLETIGLKLAEPFLEPLELGIRKFSELINQLPIDQWVANLSQSLTTLMRAAQEGAFSFDNIIKKLREFGSEIGSSLSDAVLNAIPDLRRAIERFGQVIIDWISDITPAIIDLSARLSSAIIAWIDKAIPLAVNALMTYRNRIVDFILSNAPVIIDALNHWSVALLEWISKAAPGMLRSFTEKTVELINLIGAHTPIILGKLGDWGGALGRWIVNAAPGMLRELGSAVGLLLDAIGRNLPGIVTALTAWGQRFIEWLPVAAPKMLDEALKLYTQLLRWITERIPGIASQLGTWAVAFVEWVGPTSGKLLIAAGEMFGKLLGWIIANGPWITQTLIKWTSAFVSWITDDAIPAVLRGLAGLGSSIMTWIATKAKDIAKEGSIGRALLDGITGGISSTWGTFIAWLNEKWTWFMSSVYSFFGIHSPSTVFAKVGRALMEGLRAGIEFYLSSTRDFVTRFINDTILNPITNAVNNVFQKGKEVMEKIRAGMEFYFSATRDFTLRFINETILNPITSVINNVIQKGREVMEKIRTGMESAMSLVRDACNRIMNDTVLVPITNNVNNVFQKGKEVMEKIRAGMEYYYSATRDFANRFMNETVFDPIKNMVNNVFQKGKEVMEKIRAGMESYRDEMSESVKNLVNSSILSPVRNIIYAADSIAYDFVNGIWNGLSNYWKGLVKKISGLAALLPEGVRKILGISSPSKVAADTIGQPLAEGIGVGFAQGIQALQRSMQVAAMDIASPQIIAPAMSAGQMQSQNIANTITNQRNYYYSPTYGGAPASPVQDFAMMQALAI